MPNGIQNGVFVPLTNIWDVEELQSVDVQSPEFKELLVRLYQNINNICMALNIKDTGQYQLSEFVNGQVFFPNPLNNTSTAQQANGRQVFRKVFNFGALPNGAFAAPVTQTMLHGIFLTPKTSFTRIYGIATNAGAPAYLPLPYVAPQPAPNSLLVPFIVSLEIIGTTIVVISNANFSAYTQTYIIVEYMQE